MYKLEDLNAKKVAELKIIAKELNISRYEKLKKQDLAYAILDYQAENAKQQDNSNKPQTTKQNNYKTKQNHP